MANEYFSLEFGDSFIRVADGEYDGQKIEFSAIALHEEPISFFTSQNEKSIDQASNIVEKLLTSLKIQKKMVNIILPDTYSYSQILSMPSLKEKELLSAIRYQADQFIPLPIDESSLDLDILYEDKANKTLLILIVAASQNVIDIAGRIVEKIGLIPQTIENEISATSRLVTTVFRQTRPKQPLIFVNFGYYSTSLYFYNPTLNLISNIYNFKSGYDLFLREVQVNFNLDQPKAADALKNIGMAAGNSLDINTILQPVFKEFLVEIEKFITSVKEKEKITSIGPILSFNLANHINQFDKELGKRFGVDSTQLDISPYIKANASFNVFKTQYSSFISLAGGVI